MMFIRFTRLSLRRSIHTQATRPSRSSRALFAASAATATYFTWRSLAEPEALDSPSSIQPVHRTPVSSTPSPSSSLSESTPETRVAPDPELSSEQPTTSSFSQNDSVTGSSKDQGDSGKGEEVEGEVKKKEEDDEGSSSSAFNPQTGEINWDCPCLGGMAHGPCGPEFREAFSCFVFSEQEPKGIDCVERFQAMQNCFRAHPEIYSDEIMDDDEEEEDAPMPEVAPITPKLNGDAPAPPVPQTQHRDTTSASP